jgi:hypothetical protein
VPEDQPVADLYDQTLAGGELTLEPQDLFVSRLRSSGEASKSSRRVWRDMSNAQCAAETATTSRL